VRRGKNLKQTRSMMNIHSEKKPGQNRSKPTPSVHERHHAQFFVFHARLGMTFHQHMVTVWEQSKHFLWSFHNHISWFPKRTGINLWAYRDWSKNMSTSLCEQRVHDSSTLFNDF